MGVLMSITAGTVLQNKNSLQRTTKMFLQLEKLAI